MGWFKQEWLYEKRDQAVNVNQSEGAMKKAWKYATILRQQDRPKKKQLQGNILHMHSWIMLPLGIIFIKQNNSMPGTVWGTSWAGAQGNSGRPHNNTEHGHFS